MKRFHLVVLNHRRLAAFLNNFQRIRQFDPTRDRVTVLSASPSLDERTALAAFTQRSGVPVAYVPRPNRGLGEGARVDLFLRRVPGLEDALDYEYLFHMQDHYLDADSAWSRYGPEQNHAVKEDVVPDDAHFDLDDIAAQFDHHRLTAAFCDRAGPWWCTYQGRRHVAPGGGNFILRSHEVLREHVQQRIRKLGRVYDGSYRWALHAEFLWGVLWFEEGKNYYDLHRRRVISAFPQEEFPVYPGTQDFVHAYTGNTFLLAVRGLLNRPLLRVRTRLKVRSNFKRLCRFLYAGLAGSRETGDRRLKQLVQRVVNRCGYRIERFQEEVRAPLDTLDLAIHKLVDTCPDPFFVQVGAHDGVTGDPIRKYVTRFHWRGLLVEPQPRVFQSLQRNYAGEDQLLFENAAVAEHDGRARLFVPDETVPAAEDLSVLASLREEVVTGVLNAARDQRVVTQLPRTAVLEVPALSVPTLLSRHRVSRVDLLQVDTEGYDCRVVRQFLDCGMRPLIIHFEHAHVPAAELQDCYRALVDAGYRFQPCEMDTVACWENG